MSTQSERSVRIKQFKVWTVMAATLILGILLAFGRWASDDPLPMGLGGVAWQAIPAGWILTIEYGVLVAMVAAVIRADRVDSLLSSRETLIWLGGIGLFTAGLYHDNFHGSIGVWAGTVNGYGTVTEFLRMPSLSAFPRLLAVWPMAYALIATTTSFVTVMGWNRPFLRWRWILHALFLFIVTAAWIELVLLDRTMRNDSRLLAGSFVVFPVLVVTVALVRDPERKIAWMNVIASAWLATAFFPQFDIGGLVLAMTEALARMRHGYRMLVLGDLLILVGSVSILLAKKESGAAAGNSSQR